MPIFIGRGASPTLQHAGISKFAQAFAAILPEALFGALVGGILLGVAQALAVVFLGAAFKNVAALSILLLFLFFRPTGLLGAAK